MATPSISRVFSCPVTSTTLPLLIYAQSPPYFCTSASAHQRFPCMNVTAILFLKVLQTVYVTVSQSPLDFLPPGASPHCLTDAYERCFHRGTGYYYYIAQVTIHHIMTSPRLHWNTKPRPRSAGPKKRSDMQTLEFCENVLTITCDI